MRLDKLAIKVATIVAGFTLTQLSACVGNTTGDRDNYSVNTLVDTGEITENTHRFIGRSVLIRNDVLQIIGNRGLILDKDRLIDGEPILVINMSETSIEISHDKTPEILIDGKVERFSKNSIEQKYDLNLESEIYGQYEGKPVIIATSLIMSPDPEDITANPEIYYNRPLAIKGEVDDVEDYGIFEIDEEQAFGGEDLLVVQFGSQAALNEEQTVIVYGVLRKFVMKELLQDYDLDWDSSIQTQIEAEHQQKPVLVTNKIQFL